MRGTRRFGWLTAAALSFGMTIGTGPAAAEAPLFVEAGGALTDLAPSTANVTDEASAELYAFSTGSSTYFVFFLSGLDPEAEGETYGAHVHVGPCVEGNGAAAGPHYNTGGTPTPETEVWLDFEVLPGGYGIAITEVPFTIEPGTAQSVVVHAQPTQAGGDTPGAAGGRIACLPVEF